MSRDMSMASQMLRMKNKHTCWAQLGREDRLVAQEDQSFLPSIRIFASIFALKEEKLTITVPFLFLEAYSLHLMIYNQATNVETRYITKGSLKFPRYMRSNNIHIILLYFWQPNNMYNVYSLKLIIFAKVYKDLIIF